MTTYSVTETAKLVRKALKQAFPDTKFSVRSRKYAGGSSLDVFWTDGPTWHAVEAITDHFRGATFDGMQNMSTPLTHYVDGVPVRYASDCILTERTISDELLRVTAQQVLDAVDLVVTVTPEEVCEAYRTGMLRELSREVCRSQVFLSEELADALECQGLYAYELEAFKEPPVLESFDNEPEPEPLPTNVISFPTGADYEKRVHALRTKRAA